MHLGNRQQRSMSDLRAEKRALRAIPKLVALRENRIGSSTSPVAERPVDNVAGVTSEPSIVSQSTGFWVSPIGRLFIGASGTALYFTCVYSAYSPASAGDTTATIIMLFSGWVFAVSAFTLSESLSSLSNGHRFIASFSFAIVIGVITVIWGKTIFHEPVAPIHKTGARIFFRLSGITKGETKMTAAMNNYGDIPARAGTSMRTSYYLADHVLSGKEEDDKLDVALKNIPSLGAGVELPVNMGRNVFFDISLTDAQYDGVIGGTMHLYVVTAVLFRDELTPSGKTNLASACSRFSKSSTDPFLCLTHNESRIEAINPRAN